MTQLSEAIDTPLRWTQPDLAVQGYELRTSQDGIVARLRFDATPSVAWSLRHPKTAVVEDGASSWDLSVRRPGWAGALGWSATVAIAGPQSGELLARSFLTTGRLVLEGQQTLRWRGSLARGGSSAFLSPTAEPIVAFQPGSFSERVNTVVRLRASALPPSHLLLLAGLGLYVRLLMGQRYR
jgi:hypothetical protein